MGQVLDVSVCSAVYCDVMEEVVVVVVAVTVEWLVLCCAQYPSHRRLSSPPSVSTWSTAPIRADQGRNRAGSTQRAPWW